MPMKKESTRVFDFSDKFPYFISTHPGLISYFISSSVRSSTDLINVCANAVAPAQTISYPNAAYPACPDIVTPSSRTFTSIKCTASCRSGHSLPVGDILDRHLSTLQISNPLPTYLPAMLTIPSEHQKLRRMR